MKTFIVPIDFSPASINAMDYAVNLAMLVDAEICLVHIFSLPERYLRVSSVSNPGLISGDAENRLYNLRRKIQKRTGNSVRIRSEVRPGKFFETLRSVCEEIKPYAVLIGSQGKAKSVYQRFGSHSVSAIKYLSCPLIFVPNGKKFEPVKKMGLAFDFREEPSEKMIEELKTFAHDFKVQIHVLYINHADKQDLDAVFESGAIMSMLSPLPHEYHFITGKNTRKSILSFCKSNGIDLLIVVPKRRNLFEKLVRNSHTREFVLHSHIPVMSLQSQTA